MTLLDALARIEEAAGKANSLPMKVNRYDHGGGRFWTELDGKRNLIADFYEEGDREYYLAASPSAILSLLARMEALEKVAALVEELWDMDEDDDRPSANERLSRALDDLAKDRPQSLTSTRETP